MHVAELIFDDPHGEVAGHIHTLMVVKGPTVPLPSHPVVTLFDLEPASARCGLPFKVVDSIAIGRPLEFTYGGHSIPPL